MPLVSQRRFELTTQELHNWCWASVSAGVHNYLADTIAMSQCQAASKILKRSCCDNKNAFDRTHSVSDSLNAALKDLGWRCELRRGPLQFSETQAQIDADKPVCARIVWSGGQGAHVNVIYGYRSSANGRQELFVSDSFFVDSVIDYDFFVSSYQDEGVWSETILLHRID